MQKMQFQLMVPGPVVKRLIIINLAIWVVFQLIVESFFLDEPDTASTKGLLAVWPDTPTGACMAVINSFIPRTTLLIWSR